MNYTITGNGDFRITHVTQEELQLLSKHQADALDRPTLVQIAAENYYNAYRYSHSAFPSAIATTGLKGVTAYFLGYVDQMNDGQTLSQLFDMLMEEARSIASP